MRLGSSKIRQGTLRAKSARHFLARHRTAHIRRPADVTPGTLGKTVELALHASGAKSRLLPDLALAKIANVENTKTSMGLAFAYHARPLTPLLYWLVATMQANVFAKKTSLEYTVVNAQPVLQAQAQSKEAKSRRLVFATPVSRGKTVLFVKSVELASTRTQLVLLCVPTARRVNSRKQGALRVLVPARTANLEHIHQLALFHAPHAVPGFTSL